MRRLILIASVMLAPLCAAAEPAIRILFVGNSLTVANDLPRMVAEIGAAAGREVVTEMVAFPNFALQDHLRDGRAVAALRRDKWDWVVLQQGPSAREDSRLNQILNARRFADLIRKSGASPALMMVWPARGRFGDMDDVAMSIRMAGKAARAVVIPAGQSWREAWKTAPALPFYSDDGFHPSRLGSYLAALMTYRSLIGPLPELHGEDAGADRTLQILLHAAAVTHAQK